MSDPNGKYQVVPMPNKPDRFAVADPSGKIADDADGWGYKTKQNAHKAAWYKLSGGKKNLNNRNGELKRFLKDHPGLGNFIDEVLERNVKGFAFGNTPTMTF